LPRNVETASSTDCVPFTVQFRVLRLTNQLSSSEHPHGVLIEEAAKRWLPEQYAQWLIAAERWANARRSYQSKTHFERLGIYEESHELRQKQAAAQDAEQALIKACRQKLIDCEWAASGLRGNPDAARRSLDGDFFIDASFAIDGSGRASSGRPRVYGGPREIEIYGLRVRRTIDVAKEPDIATTPRLLGGIGVSTSEGVAARAFLTANTLEPPIYPEPVKFLAQNPPKQFLDWAESVRRSVGTITQGSAMAAMEKIFGAWPQGPSQKTVIAWCHKLNPEWTAKQGTPPSRRSS
jgi:hypothetical protein